MPLTDYARAPIIEMRKTLFKRVPVGQCPRDNAPAKQNAPLPRFAMPGAPVFAVM